MMQAPPALTPSARRVPERRTVSLERRFDVTGAPHVADRLRSDVFEPVDVLLWVSLDVGTDDGRWSTYLWAAGEGIRDSAQFDGPVTAGEIVVHRLAEGPPGWVRDRLVSMLAEVRSDAQLLGEDR